VLSANIVATFSLLEDMIVAAVFVVAEIVAVAVV